MLITFEWMLSAWRMHDKFAVKPVRPQWDLWRKVVGGNLGSYHHLVCEWEKGDLGIRITEKGHVS